MSKKNLGKDTRAPIGSASDVNKMDDAEKSRVAIGTLKRLDASHYLRMEKYKGKQLFWAHSNGEADKWLSLGAKPVEKKAKSATIYKGINDRETSEWEMVPAVSVVEGVKIDAFLLYMEDEDYQRYRVDPLVAKNDEIRHAMGIGQADTGGERVMPSVKGLKTYAPNVSENNKGLEVRQGGEITHDV